MTKMIVILGVLLALPLVILLYREAMRRYALRLATSAQKDTPLAFKEIATTRMDRFFCRRALPHLHQKRLLKVQRPKLGRAQKFNKNTVDQFVIYFPSYCVSPQKFSRRLVRGAQMYANRRHA
jgi:hypothetical protein